MASNAPAKRKSTEPHCSKDTDEGSPGPKSKKQKICDEKYTFFYGSSSPFSQHHPCKFTVKNNQFNCAEQYMMYQKAGNCVQYCGRTLGLRIP